MDAMTAQVAIAATGPVSLAVATQVAREGGNAVDIAIAAAVTAMSTEPGIVSLGAGAFVNIWPDNGEPQVIDGNVEMPGRGLPAERFGEGLTRIDTEYGGGTTLYAGHGAVATPGALTSFQLAVEEHGRLPWADVIAPAAQAARAGYPIGGASARYLAFTADTLYALDPDAHALVTRPGGGVVQPGDTGYNHQLADTLDLVAAEGASVLTTGEIGRAMVADMERHGGLITHRDLAEYTPLVRPPLRRQVGDWDLAMNPPPSVGGPMLAVMLGELGRYGYWHWPDIIEIQRAVLAYRVGVHDVAPDLEYAGHELLLAVERHGLAGLPTSSSTANISVVDEDGMACAVTCSSGYGAGVTIPGTGIILNNALGEVELNRLGLHALTPGTRLASNMAPTTGRTEDGRALAIGSPGADRITTALMLVLGQGCLHGEDLQAAITSPRLHVRFTEDGEPFVEREADAGIERAVRAAGYPSRDHGSLSMYFGGVGAAYRGQDGRLQAAGDPRREAEVTVLTL